MVTEYCGLAITDLKTNKAGTLCTERTHKLYTHTQQYIPYTTVHTIHTLDLIATSHSKQDNYIPGLDTSVTLGGCACRF